jgi:hypothetical protein
MTGFLWFNRNGSVHRAYFHCPNRGLNWKHGMYLTMQSYWAIRDFHDVAPPAYMHLVTDLYADWLENAANFQSRLSPAYIPTDLKNAFCETFLWLVRQVEGTQGHGDQEGNQDPGNQVEDV